MPIEGEPGRQGGRLVEDTQAGRVQEETESESNNLRGKPVKLKKTKEVKTIHTGSYEATYTEDPKGDVDVILKMIKPPIVIKLDKKKK